MGGKKNIQNIKRERAGKLETEGCSLKREMFLLLEGEKE
jgi:hypothetical protein